MTTGEFVFRLHRDHLRLETAGNTGYHAGGVVDAHRMGLRLLVVRGDHYVEVTPTGHRNNPDAGGSSCDLVPTGRRWPIGNARGTGRADIDGVAYRICTSATSAVGG